MRGIVILLFFGFLLNIYISEGQALMSVDTLVSVKGMVSNRVTKKPIKAMIIYQMRADGGNMGSTMTRDDGHYEVTLIKSTEYDFLLFSEGYSDLSELVLTHNYDAHFSIVKNFELNPNTSGSTLILNSLVFELGKNKIQKRSEKELDDLAEAVHNNRRLIIQLEGHTDYRGSAKANLRLAKRRVEAVKKYLIDKGVSPRRIKLKSFGGKKPLVRSNDAEKRKVNRRVEVRILKN